MAGTGWQDATPGSRGVSGTGDRVFNDLRRDKEQRDKLAATWRRYEDFLRSTVDWLWETDAQGRLSYVSSPVALKLGIPAQVLTGRPLLDLGQSRPDRRHPEDLARVFPERRPFRSAPFVMRSAQKREIAYLMSGVPVFADSSGRFLGYRGTAIADQNALVPAPKAESQDSAELLAVLEDLLLRHQDLAWRYARSREQGESGRKPLRKTAHELRTPLNAIIGYADLGAKRIFGPLPDRYVGCFSTILEAAGHLNQLVEQLSREARQEAQEGLKLERFNLDEIIAKAKAIVALSARKAKVSTQAVKSGSGALVRGNRLACTQILVNLMTNAIKFTPPGGSVGLEVRQRGKFLDISVWDTGMGIAPAEQEKIFSESYRAKQADGAKVPGSGLGLGISRNLAREMGGDIRVASQPGKGARFTLSLPMA